MKMSRCVHMDIVLLAGMLMLLFLSNGWAVEPTIARLSFWTPPERMAEFETAYREQVLPILKQHGLKESSERGRTTVDSVFARLFLLESASEVASVREKLQDDSEWQTVRMVRRDRRLQIANAELPAANREIQAQTERKSKFLASMSHELRIPMNAILGFTNMVLRREGDRLSEKQQGNLSKVMEAGNRLLGLINDLLDLSKVEAGRMDVEVKRFSVESLVRSCCAEVEPLVAEKSGVKLVCDVADGVGEAETDEGRVRQILTNLLSNAIKFTSQGEVRVAVEHCQFSIEN